MSIRFTAEGAEGAETGRVAFGVEESDTRYGEHGDESLNAPVVKVRRLGVVPYANGLRLQDELVRARRVGEISDQLLLLEHPHVITLGSSGEPEHVLAGEEERRLLGIELFETGRGGDVTYHGPGQLVGYPILALEPARRDLHRYLRDIERTLILALADFGIQGRRREGLTGVWVGPEKIAAIGVRASTGWITSHGFALNVSTDLRLFDSIVPCGIRGYGVTSLERELDRSVAMEDVMSAVAARFGEVFGREVYESSGREVGANASSSGGGANS